MSERLTLGAVIAVCALPDIEHSRPLAIRQKDPVALKAEASGAGARSIAPINPEGLDIRISNSSPDASKRTSA